MYSKRSRAVGSEYHIVQHHRRTLGRVMAPTASLVLPAIALGLAALECLNPSDAFLVTTSAPSMGRRELLLTRSRAARTPTTTMSQDSATAVKSKILQLAAVTDRGAMANAGVSNAYLGTKDDMRRLVESLEELEPVDKPLTAAQLSGRWELVYTTVELFRTSPFFQMVEGGYDDPEKSNLFFKLHQLQTGSWGASSIGRIIQIIDLIDSVPPRSSVSEGGEETTAVEGGGEETAMGTRPSGSSGSLESEVDLIILPLTSLPLVGFWKLLPTFGGCIATKAHCSLAGDNNEVVELVVESTKLKAVEDVPLLPLAGSFFENKDFPTGEVAKKVMGNVPVTKQTVVCIDDVLRVMRDKAGELYIYSRPLESL